MSNLSTVLLDNIDAVSDKNHVPVPKQDTPPKQSTPKVVKTETIVSESYIETRKRVVANNKTVDTAIKSQQLQTPVKISTIKHVDSGSWEWKAVLVFLALITTVLLIYYFMEGNHTPRLKSGEI